MLTTWQEIIELFPHALIAGCVIAVTCALFGVFVILNRVVFISVALSETAACGIAVAMLLHVNPYLGAGVFCLLTVLLLSFEVHQNQLPRDAFLGVIFAGAAALSVLLVSHSGFGLHDVKALLYGDLIVSSKVDCYIILAIHVPALVVLIACLRPMLYTFFDQECASVMGMRTRLWELFYFVLLGLVVSAASKIAGALLVFSFLVIIPAVSLLLTRRWGWVLLCSPLVALVATLTGIHVSYTNDLPANQTIILTACGLFLVATIIAALKRVIRR